LTDLLHGLPEMAAGAAAVARRGPRQPWQCSAATVVTLLTEVVYGASAAWEPVSWLERGGGQVGPPPPPPFLLTGRAGYFVWLHSSAGNVQSQPTGKATNLLFVEGLSGVLHVWLT